MKFRLTLADKISAAIIAIAIFCVLLVFYISNFYRQLSYEHHQQSIQQLVKLVVADLTENLKTNVLDLALAIEHENNFNRDYRYKYAADLKQQLNNQFDQYFVTAGVIKLLKLYVLDPKFTLISYSSEGIETDVDSEIICPHLSQYAAARKGSELLQTLSRSCLYKNKPVYTVIVPFGGLNPKGYIQVVSDLAYSLKEIEQSLAMPIQITAVNKQVLYQSKQWQERPNDLNSVDVKLKVFNDIDDHIMTITLKSDMTAFNKNVIAHRNQVMGFTVLTTGIIVLIVLFMLRKSAIPPLAKIHDVLEKIHKQSGNDSEGSRILFEQLLDQIITLRKKSRSQFSVMILDLDNFNHVNENYGSEIGDSLLIEIELRLSSVLRGSDMVSWVGTDSPGHKLLPTDTKTQYRATIARHGGDEFGLLLPSAETPDEAKVVAKRIVDSLNRPFQINQHSIEINCKIGISIYPIHGDDESILIRNADKAMYQAKALKLPTFVFDDKL